MDFKEQVLAVFAGSFSAFVFAIVLFFLTRWLTAKQASKSYKKLLKREFSYNISLLQNWLDEISDVLGKISADDRSIFNYFTYTRFQVYFLNESFKLGIVYSLFKKDEDIIRLNDMLSFFSIGEKSGDTILISLTEVAAKAKISSWQGWQESSFLNCLIM